ncbi:MAG: NAD(P)-dependent oxidoreductase [Pseudomonadota bacterium]
MSRTVGLFGLGLVGMAAAGRLLESGYDVVGFDPSGDRIKLLQQAGGESADADLIWQKASVIFVAVFDTDQLAALVEGAPTRSEAILIVLSTCDPDRMAEIGKAAEAKSIELIEAPLSGTSKQLAKGDAVFFVGGNVSCVDRLASLFGAMGKTHHYVGELGNGNRTKLAINLILGLNRAALAEGLVLAERLGLEPGEFLKLAQGSAANSAVMATKGPLMVSQDFNPQGRISQSYKDFSLIVGAANSVDQKLPFGETYLAMMNDCIENGEEAFDNAAIISAISRQASDKS